MIEFIEICKKYNLEVNENQCEQFRKYYELLVDWNNRINLTSITEKNEVMIKHFLDSIIVSKFVDFNNKTLIDVGTGAGFPGLPLKIFNPGLNVVLLDSLNKRINFLNEVIIELNLSNIETIHYRAEDGAHDKIYREKFDFCTSRAVANLSTLSEYCLPFVKIGGSFISFKSDNCEEEINNAKFAISTLGGKIKKIESFSIDNVDGDSMGRSLIFISKEKNSGSKYPRKAGVPSKSPL